MNSPRLFLILLCASALILHACASTKEEAKKEESGASAGLAAKTEEAKPAAAPDAYDADKPDSNGVVKARYYGQGLDVLLGRSVRWCVENGWQILNDGAGANGTVVAKGSLKNIQRVLGTPETGQHAEYPCSDCGHNDKGQIYADEGHMVIKVKTIGIGRTLVTVTFNPIPPPGAIGGSCRTTGKFETMMLDYLLRE